MIRCDSCGLMLRKSELTNSTFMWHDPTTTAEVAMANRCPRFGAQNVRMLENSGNVFITDDDVPSVMLNKEAVKERVLIQVQMRRWARLWYVDFHDWVEPW